MSEMDIIKKEDSETTESPVQLKHKLIAESDKLDLRIMSVEMFERNDHLFFAVVTRSSLFLVDEMGTRKEMKHDLLKPEYTDALYFAERGILIVNVEGMLVEVTFEGNPESEEELKISARGIMRGPPMTDKAYHFYSHHDLMSCGKMKEFFFFTHADERTTTLFDTNKMEVVLDVSAKSHGVDGDIWSIMISEKTPHVIYIGGREWLFIFDWKKESPINTYECTDVHVTFMELSEHGECLYVGFTSGYVDILKDYLTTSPRIMKRLDTGRMEWINGILQVENMVLTSTYVSARIDVFDIHNKTREKSLSKGVLFPVMKCECQLPVIHEEYTTRMKWMGSKDRILTCAQDGMLLVWKNFGFRSSFVSEDAKERLLFLYDSENDESLNHLRIVSFDGSINLLTFRTFLM